jgi:hypothetical protein
MPSWALSLPNFSICSSHLHPFRVHVLDEKEQLTQRDSRSIRRDPGDWI